MAKLNEAKELVDNLNRKAAEQSKVLADKQEEADQSLGEITSTMQVRNFLEPSVFKSNSFCTTLFMSIPGFLCSSECQRPKNRDGGLEEASSRREQETGEA